MPDKFDEAFSSAVEQHSPKEERAAEEPEVTEQTQPPNETAVESSEPEATTELLSKEEVEKLKGDPVKLEAEFKRAYTKKTQELAEQRKALEPYAELIRAFQADPKAVSKQLFDHYNGQPGATQAEATAQTKALVDRLKEASPELGFVAERYAPIIQDEIQAQVDRVKQELMGELEPVRDGLTEQVLEKEVGADLAEFEAKFPDWKKHEAKMSEIMRTFQPAPDPITGEPPTTSDYMANVYYLATRDLSNAEKTKQVLQRMTDSANQSESPGSAMPENRVAKAPPPAKNFNEAFDRAFKDAKAGIRYEY